MGKHLSYDKRLVIEALYHQRVPVKQIALRLCVHPATIYREIKRGTWYREMHFTDKREYSAVKAQQKHDYAATAKGRPLKIGGDHAYAAFLEETILSGYSPAAALAEARRNGRRFRTHVSVSTLYSYIDKELFLRLTNKNLLFKSKRKKRQPRPVRPFRLEFPCISERPDHINGRGEFGHWEMDLVCGRVGYRSVLLTLTERMTRQEIILKLPNKQQKSVVSALNRLERSMPHFKRIFRSITVDNGMEFFDLKGIQRSIHGGPRTMVYFCHPYSSWERGSNENANGIIRRFVKKGTDIGEYSEEDVQRVQDWMNNYPRRILGYESANDVFQRHVSGM